MIKTKDKSQTIITSLHNESIQLIAKLKDAKWRKQQGLFVAQGKRICSTLISSRMSLVQLYLTEGVYDDVLSSDIINSDKITMVSDQVMKKISPAVTPSGVVGVFRIPQQPSFDELGSGIVLSEMSDPGNVGTLIRSALAMDRLSIVIIGGVDPWSPKVVQASAGYIGLVKLYEIDWQELFDIKKKRNLKLIALVARGGKRPEEIDFKDSLLVVGSEAHGISDQWVAKCDQRMTLPMPGNTESLNAAIAGSIAMYVALF